MPAAPAAASCAPARPERADKINRSPDEIGGLDFRIFPATVTELVGKADPAVRLRTNTVRKRGRF
ncbi:hypothetical protein J2X36_004042 [Methylobacterium sp. BE186]|uniref:hypothetical protein n=1 Tax=Methylobacterium sp. BE186 TaxID=2817715 RepID=UPI0028593DC6|nr:hypothetical protein [Methylobacterium sp. BE186]MDR7039269.1 hypothetical protein [Methylobacterium sp. BE186]